MRKHPQASGVEYHLTDEVLIVPKTDLNCMTPLGKCATAIPYREDIDHG